MVILIVIIIRLKSVHNSNESDITIQDFYSPPPPPTSPSSSSSAPFAHNHRTLFAHTYTLRRSNTQQADGAPPSKGRRKCGCCCCDAATCRRATVTTTTTTMYDCETGQSYIWTTMHCSRLANDNSNQVYEGTSRHLCWLVGWTRFSGHNGASATIQPTSSGTTTQSLRSHFVCSSSHRANRQIVDSAANT